MQNVDDDGKPLARGVSPSAGFALEHNGMYHDPSQLTKSLLIGLEE